MPQWNKFKNLILLLINFWQDNRMLGMGCGQPNRVESLRIAVRKAGDEVKGAALASDAFFPFGKCYWHIKYLQCRNSQLV